ncbi:pyrroloquinoline quinone biosynthesis protein PqqF [Acerihabitans sp. TG2]|uniref:pyrroloquinoline quinone biosynthesis protein PqqF n=1 Tax=Acerihabitans sp. TG2 TaxID=3096008 RepID=UPI002B23A8A3|nr:pyrroloquinoline quinone biosynthesis protein PqqF [Acerihabitans sp. TG2]MEA9392449.1 pyrroloquinoline quinone biosynthesis protein PqqF [Acerihabitans sp. TG2]
MSGGRQIARLRLANGLRLCLRHDAQATEAAALLQVAVGSDAEPPAWPGLAHLLEHQLFTGSKTYQQQQRLLAWIPAHGGRLNATTRSDRSAFFFALDPTKLAPALARLADMLAAPSFDLAALEQEINVIEAEYRLLLNDPDTLCDAAQLHLFDGAPALRRFQVGNRVAFGADLPSLQQALQDFHRCHYQAGQMTLWLQGPQPLAELRALADRLGACLPASRTVIPSVPLRLATRGDAMLRVAGAPRLRLSFALNGWQDCDAGWFDVLRTLLNDEADGSLMAWLREREWCDGARLMNSWRGTDVAIVAVEFTLAQADPALGVQVERGFLHWLKQLSALSEQQLQHYAWLAQRRFDSQTPLDQLRDLAFDAPALSGIDTHTWQRWLSRFRPEGISRLWLDEQVTGILAHCRGFSLQLAPFIPPAVAPSPVPTCCFPAGHSSAWTQPLPWMPSVSRTVLPVESVRLRHIAAAEAAVLMLYSAPGSDFTQLQKHVLHAALRAPAANLAHGGGEIRIEWLQGAWLLQLGADDDTMSCALEAISTRLRGLSEWMIRQGQRARQHELQQEQGQIPVRRLLRQLPCWLSAVIGEDNSTVHCLADISWQGTLYGGTASLHHRLSHMLSCFPGTFTTPTFPSSAATAAPLVAVSSCADASTPAVYGQTGVTRFTLTQTEGDNAFVLFCPLPDTDINTQLAWRLLGLIYQPLFFQQLRVEQNVGYVANCRFHDMAWRSGILFVLQSPHLNGEDLHQRTLLFLQQMDQRLGEMPVARVAELRSTLWQMLTHRDANRFIRARQACFTLDQALTTPQAQARLEKIDQKALKRWHRIFSHAATHSRDTMVATTTIE